jgi:hypothetical protein
MYLRSQDKNQLVPMGRLETYNVYDWNYNMEHMEIEQGEYLHTQVKNDDCVIGKYESENRAIEVLDEITDAYIKCRPCGGQIEINIVYQMPEKYAVEG